MKNIHDTSMTLQRRATVQLDYLTSYTSLPEEGGEIPLPDIQRYGSLSPLLETEEFFSPSLLSSTPNMPLPLSRGSPPLPLTSNGSEMLPKSTKLATVPLLSVPEFEKRAIALLASAAVEKMGRTKRFTEDFMSQLSIILSAVGNPTWSERPKTKVFIALTSPVLEGYNDIDFPYSESTLPNLLHSVGARNSFLRQ